MARDYFKRSNKGVTSPNGTIVSDIQLTLNAMGMGQIDVDGIFGGQTEKALISFQEQTGLPRTGTVSDETWQALMNNAEPSIFERCLQVTASFEGTGFTRAVGNFDGAGVTWGIIGFTLVNGELGAILSAIAARHPDLLSKAFGGDAGEALKMCSPETSKGDKIEWANSITRQRFRLAEPWNTYFHDLGSFREVQKLQVERAKDVYWTTALKDAEALDMTEELDLLLLYDVAVQNGGMKSKNRRAKALDLMNHGGHKSPQAKRDIVARVVTESITSQFKEDVRLRKVCIASGQGTVHMGAYELANWGLLNGQTPKVLS